MKTKDQCLEIAARIWCDQEMQTEVMQPKLAMHIANLLHRQLGKSQTTTATQAKTTNPWLNRKINKDMLEKLVVLFEDVWEDAGTYGTVAAKLDEDLMDFFFSCTVDDVDGDEDTVTVRFAVPVPEHI